jgi:hypothetical protein
MEHPRMNTPPSPISSEAREAADLIGRDFGFPAFTFGQINSLAKVIQSALDKQSAAHKAEIEKYAAMKRSLTHPTIHLDYYDWLERNKNTDFWKSYCGFKTFHAIAMWVWTESRQEALSKLKGQ